MSIKSLMGKCNTATAECGDVSRLVVDLNGARLAFKGREAWTLDHLIRAGADGLTSLERPAPRWSQYVFRLRSAGIVIETIDEKHYGPFAGYHGRYVLRSELSVIERETAR